MFPDLGPLTTDAPLLHTLGRSGGLCEAITEDGGDDAREAAGWPFFGQFVAHDITADRSPVTHQADPATIRNFRTPRLNLECLYGGGPGGSPYLYDRDDTAQLLLGSNDAGQLEDPPRNAQGIALIGDPRNDVHLFMAQLHVAMIKLHNLLAARLREDGVGDAERFDEARRATSWHYAENGTPPSPCMTWKSSGLPQPKRQYAVQQLADAIGTSQQNASRHVRRLYEAGVLARREGGREVFYSVTTPALVELLAAATRV